MIYNLAKEENKNKVVMYFITVIRDETTFRTIGYFSNFKDAYYSVVGNNDIYRGIYSYAIIEELKEGLYNSGEIWSFKYNESINEYEAIETPQEFKQYGILRYNI